MRYGIQVDGGLHLDRQGQVAQVSGDIAEHWTFGATEGAPAGGGSELPIRASLDLRDGRWVITSVHVAYFHGQWVELT